MALAIKSLGLTGQRFGRLTALELMNERQQGAIVYRCLCDCGTEKLVTASHLRGKNTRSCGCLLRQHAADIGRRYGPRNKAHGLTASPEYVAWAGMKQRCTNPSNKSFQYYGGRGITLAERWRTFTNFLEDMGQRPGPDYCLSRIDNDRGYEPGNVVWDTKLNNLREMNARREAA